jgi:hypothetical protein
MALTHITSAPRLGNILVEKGYLTLEQLETALGYQKQSSAGRLLGFPPVHGSRRRLPVNSTSM